MLLGVIGDLVQDVVVWLEEAPRAATDTRCHITITRGGSAANVAAFAAPHCRTRFIACVGDDLAGRTLVADLAVRGVEVRTQTRGKTGTVVVLVDTGGERQMFPSRGASAELGPVPPEWLADVSVLHLTGYSLASEPAASSVLAAARHARRAGARLSLDVSSAGLIAGYGVTAFQDLLRDLAPDVISANREECVLLELCNGDAAGGFGRDLGAAILLARDGARPTRIWRGGKCMATVDVPPVADVRDLTGAGDAFNAGFLAAWMHGAELEAACHAGHALAGRAVRFAGASDGRTAGTG